MNRSERLESLLPGLLRRMFREADADSELLNLPLAQLRILRTLFERPRSASEIIEQLGYSASSLSQLIQRLVNAGLVVKTRDPHDARVKHLDLTEKARDLMERRRERRVEQAKNVLSRLDENEQQELLRLLEKMSRIAGAESWTNSIERLTA